jgi:hypothetical protein
MLLLPKSQRNDTTFIFPKEFAETQGEFNCSRIYSSFEMSSRRSRPKYRSVSLV